jgi:hypothetical protein
METKAIVGVISVTDTRDYIEEGDRWIPVPGSGATNQCDSCGRGHEVHAFVKLEDGTTATVGTGCMKGAALLRTANSLAGKAGRAKAKAARVAREEAQKAIRAAAWAEVQTMSVPPIVPGVRAIENGKDIPILQCGDAEVWCAVTPLGTNCPERRSCVVSSWRENRFRELAQARGFKRY